MTEEDSEVKMLCEECGHRFTEEDVKVWDFEHQGYAPYFKDIGIPHCPSCGSTEVVW